MSEEPSMTNMFELMQKMWNPMNLPLPGIATPTVNPADVEKRIVELKAVETWLTVNLNMLQATINTLQMQKAGLDALNASIEAVRSSTEAVRGSVEAERSSAEAERDSGEGAPPKPQSKS